MPDFKPHTIPAKPATEKLDLDAVAFPFFSFEKQYIGAGQPFTVRYTPMLYNEAQAASVTSPTDIITVKKQQSAHTTTLASLPPDMLQAIETIRQWLTKVSIDAGILEPV